ncbi:hypothetical protein F4775DRAFT_592237 [Biscogniauxia sp. FL1348]|nr:hypothetical protein F4775DRAFT_592237 [Biscogniauxia sp. FL1348]
MERDIRRDRSQWRGCHRFDNIICDGDQVGNSKRTGGLKMGQTYYYYYELDGSTETHDPSRPTTSTCPYLPGQTVNTLEVPREHQLRLRSASMNSLRSADFKTMDPKAKFTTPRPAPSAQGPLGVRIGSSPSDVPSRSARSLSPAPRWAGAARRFFGGLRPQSRDSERGRSVEGDFESISTAGSSRVDSRSTTPSGSIRSRDMSPESLRRFLSDDLPCTPPNAETAPPKLSIPDDIAEENENENENENEDDENFASSATSESTPFTTLSPPPFLRSVTPSVNADPNKLATTTIPEETEETPLPDTDATPVPAIRSRIPDFKLNIPSSHLSFSTISSGLGSPTSLQSTESRDFSQVSFYDDDLDDDDDERQQRKGEETSLSSTSRQPEQPKKDRRYAIQEPFTGYSLPQAPAAADKVKAAPLNTSHISVTALGSSALLARNDSSVAAAGSTGILSRPGYDSGLDDLMSDMSWMADVILPKDI